MKMYLRYFPALMLVILIAMHLTRLVAAENSGKGGALYSDPATGMEFVFVKGGCYQMGDTFGDGYQNEMPVHEVCVDDFYIGKFEVTQGQWKAVQGDNPSYFSSCGDDCPVEQVSWNDAQKFIRRMNQRTGKTYRLLTEAEWEYAARSGGKHEKYSGTSNDAALGEYAWYKDNSGNQTHPVGRKRPNGLGIYDMSGNVWEWVQDIYSEAAYSTQGKSNPVYAGSGAHRVRRGGGWIRDRGSVRAANRNDSDPDYRSNGQGFRLGMTP